jgi:RimJ/RimL family protein N-acetyltransferase
MPGDRALTLRDGATVGVRPLEPSDRATLDAAVARLSDRSRYLRFAASKPRLTARELDFLVDVDHHDREALVAIDPASGRPVAVVRYVLDATAGGVEVAATVADEWQGRGLGGAMLALLADRARAEGHRVMRANVLAANEQSIAMLRKSGFAISGRGSGLLEYERAL